MSTQNTVSKATKYRKVVKSERTAEATGVSLSSVQRILKEEKVLPSTSLKFTSSMKKRRKRDNKIEIDNFTADVIQSTIQNFHIVHKAIPTLTNLRRVLNEKIGFEGCLETLRQLLLKLGYKWPKTENNRKVLTERHDIQMWRLKYKKKMSQYRSQGRPIVYTDESYVLSTHVRNNTWAQKKIKHAIFEKDKQRK
ncbi:unnamed protein product [Euphydryas editha]|uniref:Transposase n=1 Tax=Euphydryas editha TaxID=104508 RepID=A0AAU9U8Q7_EUPED|nr:unnamed protein product [Euphydryas editha]